MDVSPTNSGTIRLEGESGEVQNPTVYPSAYIDCFDRNENVSISAIAKTGYQFNHWEFNYWPNDLNETRDRTSNPISFQNTYLLNDGYADDYDAIRTITAYFSTTENPPFAPEGVGATDGTEIEKVVISWNSSPGASYYDIYRSESISGNRVILGQTSETRYEDAETVDNTTYFYWVRANNPYGESPYSDSDSGYAYVDPQKPPPPPIYTATDLSPLEAKALLDSNPNVIVVDSSIPDDYKKNHILCAINMTWNDLFQNFNYQKIDGYQEYPLLVYDFDATSSQEAADYLAGNGFSTVYHMTGGLQQWMAMGAETVNSDNYYECDLPPMANAGPDIDGVDEYQIVDLNGFNSDTADGSDIVSYQWQQYQGTGVDILNADSANASFEAPNLSGNNEKLIFLLTVSNSQGKKDTDSMAVTVHWENDPPLADAGTSQSVFDGDRVYLDGSDASDSDNGIAFYLWEQLSGETVLLQDKSKETAWFTAPKITTEKADTVFALTVTDNGGLSDTAQVTVEIIRKNTPPVADAGSAQTVLETQRVQLDGSGSYDPDEGDRIKTYSWTQTGSNAIPVQLSDLSDKQPSFFAPPVIEGSITLEFQLTVTDQKDVQSTDRVSITINDAGDPPTANAETGSNQNFVYEGWPVTLDASESFDADGEIISYQWIQISGPNAVLDNPKNISTKFTVPQIDGESEKLVFQLMVTDDLGLNDTDLIQIEIVKAMVAPTANAGLDQTIREGETVFLDASASSDLDDGILYYSWSQTNTAPIVELSDDTSEQPEFLAPDVEEETVFSFDLTVTDYSGMQNTDEVQITVRPKSGGGGTCFISTLNQ